MASAWGLSWGRSWGNSWGLLVVQQRQEGGIGHGKKRKKRPIYIEQDGKIFLFNDPYHAAQWMILKKKEENPKAKKHKIEKLRAKVKEPKVIDLPKTESLAVKYNKIPEFKQLVIDIDYHALYIMMEKLIEMQEEEDLVVILLSI
jgi:hypothetical protein